MTKPRPRIDKSCVECGQSFTVGGQQNRQVVCSPECQRARSLRRSREWASARYEPRMPHPEKSCDECGTRFTPYTLSHSRFCCRQCQEAQRGRRRAEEIRSLRSCSRCGAAVERKPGPPVCGDCKVDKRSRVGYERRRTLGRYGITMEEFDLLLEKQEGRCAVCGSDDWGKKGPAVDHCHTTGAVRGLLCYRCNLGIGQFNDDVSTLQAAIRYLEGA